MPCGSIRSHTAVQIMPLHISGANITGANIANSASVHLIYDMFNFIMSENTEKYANPSASAVAAQFASGTCSCGRIIHARAHEISVARFARALVFAAKRASLRERMRGCVRAPV